MRKLVVIINRTANNIISIVTNGIPTFVQSLKNAGLVDEYRITIYPVIVNEGKQLFENLEDWIDFRSTGV